MRVWTTVEH